MTLQDRGRETEVAPDDGDDVMAADAVDAVDAVGEPTKLVSAWDSKPVRKQLLSPWLPLESVTWRTEGACPSVHRIRTADKPSAHAPAAPSRWSGAAVTSMDEPASAASERSGYCEEHA